MQEGYVFQRAPLAAVKGVAADEVQRPGDGCSLAIGHDQGDAIGHRLAHHREEGARQIGSPPLAVARVHVEGEEGVPGVFVQVGAGQDADVETGLGVAAFAADGLAPAGRQGPQEVVEGRVAVVAPDELHILARQQPGLGHRPPVRLGRKVDVQRRHAQPLGQGQSPLDQGLAHTGQIRVWMSQEARAGRGGEGHGAQQFGIIAAARPLIGVGPAVVEDVFALAVALQIEGHDAQHGVVVASQRQVMRSPALGRGRTARRLTGMQEGVGNEGIAGRGRAGVPRGLADVGDPVVNRDLEGQRISTMASTSTAKPSGRR